MSDSDADRQRELASKVSFRSSNSPGNPNSTIPPPAFEEDSRSSAGGASEAAGAPVENLTMSDSGSDSGDSSNAAGSAAAASDTEAQEDSLTKPRAEPDEPEQNNGHTNGHVSEVSSRPRSQAAAQAMQSANSRRRIRATASSRKSSPRERRRKPQEAKQLDEEEKSDDSASERQARMARLARETRRRTRKQEEARPPAGVRGQTKKRDHLAKLESSRVGRQESDRSPSRSRPRGALSPAQRSLAAQSPYGDAGGAARTRTRGRARTPRQRSPGQSPSMDRPGAQDGGFFPPQAGGGELEQPARWEPGDQQSGGKGQGEGHMQVDGETRRTVDSRRDQVAPRLRPQHVAPLIVALSQAEQESATAALEAQAALRKTENVMIRLAGAVQRAGASLSQALDAAGATRRSGGRGTRGGDPGLSSAFGSPLSREELEQLCKYLLQEQALDRAALAEAGARLMAPPSGDMPLQPSGEDRGGNGGLGVGVGVGVGGSGSVKDGDDTAGGRSRGETDDWKAIAEQWRRRAIEAEMQLATERRRSAGEVARSRLMEGRMAAAARAAEGMRRSIAQVMAGDVPVSSSAGPGARPVPPSRSAWGEKSTGGRQARPGSVPAGAGRPRLGATFSPRQRRGLQSAHAASATAGPDESAERGFLPTLTAPVAHSAHAAPTDGYPSDPAALVHMTVASPSLTHAAVGAAQAAAADARLRQTASNPSHALHALRELKARLKRAAREIAVQAARADTAEEATLDMKEAAVRIGTDGEDLEPAEQFADELAPQLMAKIEAAGRRASEARAVSQAAAGALLASAGGLIDKIGKKGIVAIARGMGLVAGPPPAKKKKRKRRKGKAGGQDSTTPAATGGFIGDGEGGASSGWLRRALLAASIAADMQGLQPPMGRAEEDSPVEGARAEASPREEIGTQTDNAAVQEQGTDPEEAPAPAVPRSLESAFAASATGVAPKPKPARSVRISLEPVSPKHADIHPFAAAVKSPLQHPAQEASPAPAGSPLRQPEAEPTPPVDEDPSESQVADEALAAVSTVPLAVKRVMRLAKGGREGSAGGPGVRVDLLQLRVFVRMSSGASSHGMDGSGTKGSAVPVTLRVVGQATGKARPARASGPAGAIDRVKARLEFHAVPLVDPRIGSRARGSGKGLQQSGSSADSPLLVGVPLDGDVGQAVMKAALQAGLGEHPVVQPAESSRDSRGGEDQATARQRGRRQSTARRRSIVAGLVPGQAEGGGDLAAAAAAARRAVAPVPAAAKTGPPRFGGATVVVVPQSASLQRKVVAALVRRFLPCLRVEGMGASEAAVVQPRAPTEAEGGGSLDEDSGGKTIELRRYGAGQAEGQVPAAPAGRLRPQSSHPRSRSTRALQGKGVGQQDSPARKSRPLSARPRIKTNDTAPPNAPASGAGSSGSSGLSSSSSDSEAGDSSSDSDEDDDDGVDETGRGVGEEGALPAAREGDAASPDAVKADNTGDHAGGDPSPQKRPGSAKPPMYPGAVPVGRTNPEGMLVLARDRRVVSGVPVVLDVLARDGLDQAIQNATGAGRDAPTRAPIHFQYDARVLYFAPSTAASSGGKKRRARRQSLARQTLDQGVVTADAASRPYTAKLQVPVDEAKGTKRTRLRNGLAARLRRLVQLESRGEEVPRHIAQVQMEQAAERARAQSKGTKVVVLKRRRGKAEAEGHGPVGAGAAGEEASKPPPGPAAGSSGSTGSGKPPAPPGRRRPPQPRAPPPRELLMMRMVEVGGHPLSLRVFEDPAVGSREVAGVSGKRRSSAGDGDKPKERHGRERVGLVFEATNEGVSPAVEGEGAKGDKKRPVRVYQGKVIAEVSRKEDRAARYRVRQRVVERLCTRLALHAKSGPKPEGDGKVWMAPIEWGTAQR